MSQLVMLPEDLIPPGWELLALHGGAHDGVRVWAQRPPRTIQLVVDGPEYHRFQATEHYVIEGGILNLPEDLEQMEIAP